MPTLHILNADGFPTYHLSGRHKHSKMKANTWNMLVEEMLTLIFETHEPKWFMFDGAFPYRGMLNAIYQQPGMEKYWMRRGSLQKRKKIPIDSIEFFDHIIHPEDAVPFTKDELESTVSTHQVAPISLIMPVEMWSREKARRQLGVSMDSKVVYVQLGAGRINDINSEVRIIVDALLEHDDVHVVLGESMLGERLDIALERVDVLRDYPNALYFNAFDAAVQAGGYNSFHEMRMMRLPTMFCPNPETGMDNQLSRCEVAEKEGWGVVVNLKQIEDISNKISTILSMNRDTPISVQNGAIEVSSLVLQTVE
jgi:UDP:flavonoid glycosyltransferase YjiC (YdhE family)